MVPTVGPTSSPRIELAGTWQTGLTHNAAIGSDWLLIVITTNEQQTMSTPRIVLAMTYGGQSMTRIRVEQVTSSVKGAPIAKVLPK